MGEKTFLGKTKHYLMFAGPAMIGFIAVVIIPFIYGLYLTLTDWDGIGTHKDLVGFTNYGTVFKDGDFWHSLLLTLGYVAVSVILINVVAFILAYLLTSGMKAQNFLRAGFFTPNLIGGIVLGFIWNFVFSRTLTSIGEMLGIPFLEKSWLSDPTSAFWAFVIVTVWQYSGYMMLIYVAGFVGVPKDMIEAASIDGCSGFQVTRYITLPLMVPSFVICLFLSLTRTFMVYDLNLSLTNGGPYESTKMAAMYVYQKAFNSQQYGVGQAEAIILFIVVAAVALTQTYLGKRMEVDA